jgi:hypothetical protein
MHRWPGLPAAASTMVRNLHLLLLRVGALAPRRYRSPPPRSQLHQLSRRMTVAGDPQTPLPESISTLEVRARPPPTVSPPSTTRAPLTAQHAWWERAATRAGMGSHCIVARSSLHTSLTIPPSPCPPHTTSPGRVRRNSVAPTRAALHTRISRRAPRTPLYFATRAHTSGREVARSTAQLGSSSSAAVVGGGSSLSFICSRGDGGVCA